MPRDTQHEAAIEAAAEASWRPGVPEDADWKLLTPGQQAMVREEWVAGKAAYDAARSGEREDAREWTLRLCPECGWSSSTHVPRGLCCSTKPHQNYTMDSFTVVPKSELERVRAARSGEAEGEALPTVDTYLGMIQDERSHGLTASGELIERWLNEARQVIAAALAEHPEPPWKCPTHGWMGRVAGFAGPCPHCDWNPGEPRQDQPVDRASGGEREPWTGKRLFDYLLHEAERARNPFGRLSTSGKVKWDALAARLEREIADRHPHQDVERGTRSDRKVQMYNLAGEYPELPTRLLAWPDFCIEVTRADTAEADRDQKREQLDRQQERAENAEAERECLREALHEAVHRVASVAGRLRLRGLRPEGEVHADGDYLAELLPKWRELAAAPSPDDRTKPVGSVRDACEALQDARPSPDDRGGERSNG